MFRDLHYWNIEPASAIESDPLADRCMSTIVFDRGALRRNLQANVLATPETHRQSLLSDFANRQTHHCMPAFVRNFLRMTFVPGCQAGQDVAPVGMADEKSTAGKKQENNDHGIPNAVHSGPYQCHSGLSSLYTQTFDRMENGPPK